ncbi:MAG: DegT/DnrJ/EryC1/StrS family aminotransferase, partial [Bacteroidota bacterium]
DAGMLVTNDAALAEKARMIIVHGSRVKYQHEILGINSRLDTLQAAILKVKLKYLDVWIEARRRAATKYTQLFSKEPLVMPPFEAPSGRHVYHQYTIRLRKRDTVVSHLTGKKIPHAVYYPIPLHLQEAFKHTGASKGAFPLTEQAAEEVLSLPMHTELTEDQQSYIAQSVMEAIHR